MIDDFSRRYRNEIEALSHWTRGHVERHFIVSELKRYLEEYGIDIDEACEALATIHRWWWTAEPLGYARFANASQKGFGSI